MVLIFATVVSQTSVKNKVCILAGYVVPVLQNGALKWKKKLTGVRSRAVTIHHTLTRGLMPQVQYRKFWKSMDGKCFPTRRTVLWHEPTSLWLVPKIEESTPWETLQKHWRGVYWGDPSNQTHQQRRRPDRNTRLVQTLDRCDKGQWRLHWRPVNDFVK